MPVPLRLGANQAITLGQAKATASVANAAKHAKQGLLRITPAQVAASKVAVGREITAATRVIIGCAFRLRVYLHAHVTAYPVVAATGAAERPAIETFGAVIEEIKRRFRPAGVHLDIAGRLLIDSSRRLEHGLQIGSMSNRCQCKKGDSAGASLPQLH